MIDSDSITWSALEEVIKKAQLMDPPYVRIVEQPSPSNFRFRYEREYEDRCGCIGNLVGINSTYEKRTFPKIQVMNCKGSFAVVVSCVTKDGPPYRPHPNKIVENLKKEAYHKLEDEERRGIYCKIIKNSTMTCSFPNLGILSVKKQDIPKSLKLREKYLVDPFGTGFDYTKDIDLNILRLCFQVLLKDSEGKYKIRVPPVVSEPIYDRKSISDLTIMKFSHYSAPATGGTEVILLCDRVPKESIQIWFYEVHDSNVIWESPAEFHPSDIHKQVAISFRIPRYHNENLQQPVSVYVELRDENRKGKPRPFQYLPMERDPDGIACKRKKVKERIDLERLFQGNILSGGSIPQERQMAIGIPRLSRQSTNSLRAGTSSVSGAPGSADAFAGTPIFFASESSGASAFPPVPVSVPTCSNLSQVPTFFASESSRGAVFQSIPVSASSSTHIAQAPAFFASESYGASVLSPELERTNISTSAHSPQAYSTYVTISPTDHNYSSVIPSPESMIPTINHQMMPASKPITAPVKDQMMTILESSPDEYQMRPTSESSNEENVQSDVDNDMILKLDSMDLDTLDADLPQNFSASMFLNNLNFPEHN
ncbi:embryonic polarity protein dorsal [Parasteatoda tepidariorum]|uniref:embryonic polarity protein dorsal n=1 Tax=Parasteatoda tepidariorum TaxID=114398 RepID=UPI001C7214B0|nr:embryonic polarity protein dorsal-like [Parasteatoda tepidariorum]